MSAPILKGVAPGSILWRIGRKFVICQRLESRARQVQGVTALDLMKRHIGLGSINTLMQSFSRKEVIRLLRCLITVVRGRKKV